MINMLFLKIVEMSLTAGIVILVVLFVRLFLRRLPKRFAYTLWLVAAFRLIVPITAA
ncbi:MAG: penicillin binding protein [Lachnospiraceae bacterium]|nr:penicillin binding protein [Lachnospiraceae bacterium]